MVRTYRLSDEISYSDFAYSEPTYEREQEPISYREKERPAKVSRSRVGSRRSNAKPAADIPVVPPPKPVAVVVGRNLLAK